MIVTEQDGTLARLRTAVRRRFGSASDIAEIVKPTLGGSNRTIVFDLMQPGSRRRLVSRQSTFFGVGNPFISAADQFRVMTLAYRHDIPIPEPVFAYDAEDDMGEGFVCAFVPGETMPKRVLDAPGYASARAHMAARCGAILARLHAIDPVEVDFLAATPDSVDPLAAQVVRLDSYGEPHPAIELGLRWLARNRPSARPSVLLHGDFRTGNLMVGDDGIRAVLDWECAHLGAAAEDLGWLCARPWRFGHHDLIAGGFGSLRDVLDAYAAAGGRPVDTDEVQYWSVFALVRWAVLNVMQGYGHMTGARTSLVYAACGRNTALVEYDLLMTLAGRYA